ARLMARNQIRTRKGDRAMDNITVKAAEQAWGEDAADDMIKRLGVHDYDEDDDYSSGVYTHVLACDEDGSTTVLSWIHVEEDEEEELQDYWDGQGKCPPGCGGYYLVDEDGDWTHVDGEGEIIDALAQEFRSLSIYVRIDETLCDPEDDELC